MAPTDRQGISGSKAKELSNSQLGVPDCRWLNTAAPQISIRPVSESYPKRWEIADGIWPVGRCPPGCWWTHSELPGGVQAILIHPPLTPRRSTPPWDTPFSDSSFLFPSSPLSTGQRQATARLVLTTYLPLLPKRDGKIPPSWLEKCPVLEQRLPWPNHCSSGYILCPLCHPGIQSLQTAF